MGVAQDSLSLLYGYRKIYLLEHTPVKDQHKSSTCWSFGTLSFLESEMIRMGKGQYDLSEMHIARKVYIHKVIQHIRMHGHNYFTPGGQSHDVMKIITEEGLMPEEAYSGLLGMKKHNHDVPDSLMKELVTRKVKEGKGFSKTFMDSINQLLDAHLGPLPVEFTYTGKTYTAKTFAHDLLEIQPEDYVTLTSYTHHPYYQYICLESPYNWANGLYYNVPFEEFMQIMDSALLNGYTIAWDGDVSESSFLHLHGLAYLENEDVEVNAALRQQTFDNQTTTIDHIMHIVGIAYDKEWNKYYIAKNSWGRDTNINGGYVFMTENYVKLKTVAYMVHMEAVPESLR